MNWFFISCEYDRVSMKKWKWKLKIESELWRSNVRVSLLRSASSHSQFSSFVRSTWRVHCSLWKSLMCSFFLSHSIIVKMKIEIECWQAKRWNIFFRAFCEFIELFKNRCELSSLQSCLNWDLFYVQFSVVCMKMMR